MTKIADSTAVKVRDRTLPQHQAALTLLQGRLSVPTVGDVKWLDLACGRGQIIASLDKNLSAAARKKISYTGYDLDQNFARETKKTAEKLGFALLDVRVGDLSDFDRILPEAARFDFITLTNTVHEVEPTRLATLLADCVGRLTPTGSLFIYDMERIRPPELGAVPWSRDDVRAILFELLDGLGASSYRPEVALWKHSSTDGWNVHLERQHLGVSVKDEISRRHAAIGSSQAKIEGVLRRKLDECRASLESLTIHGAETVEEQEGKVNLLYEFWSITRALERGS